MTVVTYTANPLRAKLAAFGSSVEGSSLYLLRAIDETVDSLQANEKLAIAVTELAERMTHDIQAARVEPGSYVDPEDTAINAIETGYRGLEELLPKLLAQKSSIDRDENLTDDQCELLHTAFDRCIRTFARLIEASKDLRAAVITHDLAAEPRPPQYFDSPKELISSLQSKP
jgi:hypothetical protein